MTLRNTRAVLSRERVHIPLFVVYVVCLGCGEVMRRGYAESFGETQSEEQRVSACGSSVETSHDFSAGTEKAAGTFSYACAAREYIPSAVI